MGSWWSALELTQQIFWGISIVFSVLFVIQFIVSLLGIDIDADVDADGSDFGDHSGDFSLFSLRAIIAFFTFFGWSGVLVLERGGTLTLAITYAVITGLVAFGIVAGLMYLFLKMQESGNSKTEDALLEVGEVYLTIPPRTSGKGKIHIKINGALREIDAVSDGDAIKTGTPIRVLEVLENGTVVVEPVNKLLLN